jgi:hypothetical protein
MTYFVSILKISPESASKFSYVLYMLNLWRKYIQFFLSSYIPALRTLNLSVSLYQWTCKYCYLFVFKTWFVFEASFPFLTVEFLETEHWHHSCLFVWWNSSVCYVHHTFLHNRTVPSITSDLFCCLSLMYITILILHMWPVHS